MAKHVLNSAADETDFALIGIVCPLDQYTLVSLLDESLKTSFFLSDNVPFNLKDNKLFKFSLFRFADEELGLEYYFIPNTSNFSEPVTGAPGNDLFSGIEVEESVKLIKELPKTDYFLLLKGEDIHNYQFKVLDRLKAVPEIVQVQAIEPEGLPSRRNLIF